MKQMIFRSIGLCLNALAFVAPRKAARLGLDLFCRPVRTPITPKQKAFLETAAQSGFEHNGIKIQTYRWGNGPKNILLLHGWQSHTYRWKKYIETLPLENFTIHAFDAPGHGLSGGRFLSVPLYSEVIENFIDSIGKTETIISHSLGSFSALYTLYRRPDLASKNLVTLSSPGEAQEFFDFYKMSLGLSAKAVNLIANRFEDLFQKSLRDFSAPVFASTLKISGLIIHDEEDNETSIAHAKRIHDVWRNSQFLITRGLGHNLRSDEVVNAVFKFVNRSSAHLSVAEPSIKF